MQIFTITMTPINPPLDDAPKNIVMGLANRIKNHCFWFIASFGKSFGEYPNIKFIRSPFQKSGRHSMPFLQKIFIFTVLLQKMKKIDIFQFFFTPQPYFSLVFNKLIKKHNKKTIQIVTSIHTLFEKNPNRNIKNLFFSDYVVVHSDYAKGVLLENEVKNVVRIYPGIELERFKNGLLKSNYLTALGAKPGEVNLIYPGTYKILNDSYSFDEFCKIVTMVKDKIKGVKFIMSCRLRTRQDHRLKRKFESLIENYEIREYLVLLDAVEDMPSLMADCALGIMPARREMVGILEIPMVLLEMAALGKPCIYSDVHPLEELFNKGIGVKLDDSTAQAYANSIVRLLREKEYALALARKSKEAVFEHFDMNKNAQEYQRLYDSLN